MASSDSVDVFVIGGGINGASVARDAEGRGFSVALAEMNDLASGTSSAATKLVHGGLRYLEHYEFRLVHEALAALLSYRISRITPITFSFAMNDYGFELLSDQPLPVNEENIKALFDPKDWYVDLQRSVNAAELGKRKFRDIAVIAGLIFQGYPGAQKKQRHLQNSTSLIYEVLMEHEPRHLLLQQAYNEVLALEVEAARLYASLERIHSSNVIISRPQNLTPFCFPIKVDSLREELTSEKLEDRVRRMQAQLNKA